METYYGSGDGWVSSSKDLPLAVCSFETDVTVKHDSRSRRQGAVSIATVRRALPTEPRNEWGLLGRFLQMLGEISPESKVNFWPDDSARWWNAACAFLQKSEIPEVVHTLDWHPHLLLLCSVHHGVLGIHDVEALTSVNVQCSPDFITAARWQPNSDDTLCVTSRRGVHLWRLEKKSWIEEIWFFELPTVPRCVSWAPHGRTVATADQYAIRLWDHTGYIAPAGVPTLRRWGNGAIIRLEFDKSSGSTIAAMTEKYTLVLWSTSTFEVLHKFQFETEPSIAWSPLGLMVASGSEIYLCNNGRADSLHVAESWTIRALAVCPRTGERVALISDHTDSVIVFTLCGEFGPAGEIIGPTGERAHAISFASGGDDSSLLAVMWSGGETITYPMRYMATSSMDRYL